MKKYAIMITAILCALAAVIAGRVAKGADVYGFAACYWAIVCVKYIADLAAARHVKEAEWSEEDDAGFYQCSACKSVCDWKYAYCPDCGAKMKD